MSPSPPSLPHPSHLSPPGPSPGALRVWGHRGGTQPHGERPCPAVGLRSRGRRPRAPGRTMQAAAEEAAGARRCPTAQAADILEGNSCSQLLPVARSLRNGRNGSPAAPAVPARSRGRAAPPGRGAAAGRAALTPVSTATGRAPSQWCRSGAVEKPGTIPGGSSNTPNLCGEAVARLPVGSRPFWVRAEPFVSPPGRAGRGAQRPRARRGG